MDPSKCIMCEEQDAQFGSSMCKACDDKLRAPKPPPSKQRQSTGPRPPSSIGYVPPKG